MQAEYEEIHESWELFENDVKAQDSAAYVELEAALDGVKEVVQATPVDASRVAAAYAHLHDEANEIAGHFATGAAASTLQTADATPAVVLQHIQATLAAVETGNQSEALQALRQAVALWPAVDWMDREKPCHCQDSQGFTLAAVGEMLRRFFAISNLTHWPRWIVFGSSLWIALRRKKTFSPSSLLMKPAPIC